MASEIAEVVVNCLYIEIDLIYFIRLINYDIIVWYYAFPFNNIFNKIENHDYFINNDLIFVEFLLFNLIKIYLKFYNHFFYISMLVTEWIVYTIKILNNKVNINIF